MTPRRQKLAMLLDPTSETEVKVTLTLPEGYTATAPPDFTRSAAFAEYTSTYKVKDRTLEMDRSLRYKVYELPVSEFGAYRDFLKAVSDEAGQMIQMVGASVKTTKADKEDDKEAGELIQQAFQQLKAHDQKGAKDLLDKAKARNDHQLGLWVEYGDVAWAGATDKTEAIADYKKEIDQHPENFAAYPRLAAAYTSKQQWANAEETTRSWAKADPANPQPNASLGGLQMMQGHYKEAESSIKDAIPLSTEANKLKLQLGEAELKAGDTAEGQTTLHALMENSDDTNILNGAAYELGDAGVDLAASQTASTRAVGMLEAGTASATVAGATNQDFANVTVLAANWDTLGWIDFKQNKLADAESYVRSAWLLISNMEVGEHLGAIYEAEGKKEDALTTYRLALKTLGHQKLAPGFRERKEKMEAKVALLEVAGVHEKPGPRVQEGGDELAALRTYTIPSPLHGEYASADFLLLMGDNRAQDVRFFRGDEALKKAIPALLAASYRAPVPPGSKVKLLRRGILACTTGSKTCMLVLLPPGEARGG